MNPLPSFIIYLFIWFGSIADRLWVSDNKAILLLAAFFHFFILLFVFLCFYFFILGFIISKNFDSISAFNLSFFFVFIICLFYKPIIKSSKWFLFPEFYLLYYYLIHWIIFFAIIFVLNFWCNFFFLFLFFLYFLI